MVGNSVYDKSETRIVFLDRDGIINKLRIDYVKNLAEFELLPNVGKQLAKLTKAGFKLVIITNQSAINRGLLSIEELNKIHDFLKTNLENDGCVIDSIHFCPHRPDENCDCRKPKTALLEQAMTEFQNIDLKHCWMIGDNASDILAAEKMGINYLKVESNGSLERYLDHILE